ncbi:MAG: diguanylate cyclase [Ruminococcus sp.]|nr:diguanylate cyclase [Ruminococcus sp.]
MNSKDTKVKSSVRNFVMALALLLITHILMGVTLVTMSKKTLRDQIEQRMLDVANTAAAQIDGDVAERLTADDKDTEDYQKILTILRSFQDNIDLDYIYGINPEEDGTFTFAIDPDREDPAEFGERIEATEALKKAAKGTPSVDKVSHSDDWGRFYSAYSPIYNSDGKIIGLIGVDFNADWFDDKLNSHRATAVIITMVAVTTGIVLSFVIFSQNRKRFKTMLANLNELKHETEKLDTIIMDSSIKRLDLLPESESLLLKTLAAGEAEKQAPVDEYDALNTSISDVYEKFGKYIKYLEFQTYIDDMTGVSNKAAYRNRIRELDEKINNGNADFSIAFFDINGLKSTYTYYGFEAGEKLLFECAKLLISVFGVDNIFHVTGDEFIVIMENKQHWQMKDYFAEFEAGLKRYNDEHTTENALSVAKGTITFDPEKFSSYRTVFIEVKAACDSDKDAYYRRTSSL